MKTVADLQYEIEELEMKYPNRTETYAVGGGDWSIEVYDYNNVLLNEFVGSNGTLNDEEPADLWGEYDAWETEYTKELDEQINELRNKIVEITQHQLIVDTINNL